MAKRDWTLNLGLRVDHVTGFNPESQGGGGQWETTVTTFPEQSDLLDITTLRHASAWCGT